MNGLSFRFFLFLIVFANHSYSASEEKMTLPQMRASLSPLAPDSLLKTSGFLKKENTSSSLTGLSERSSVFLIKDLQVANKRDAFNQEVVSSMLSELVCAVTGKKNTNEAWQSLIKTGTHGDVVGIKITTETGPFSGTHRALITALVRELLAAGVLREKIVVWDRHDQDLEAAGYTGKSGLTLGWVEQGGGYDPKKIFSSPLMGQLVYGDLEFQEIPRSWEECLKKPSTQLSNESHYARLLTERLDKVINVPSLVDSSYCGINGALVNMTLGVVDNWRRFIKPPSCGDPYIPMLYATEQIKNKVVLTIMDALTLQYAGGPAASPEHAITYGTLLASFDPVAIDTVGIQLINDERHARQFPEISSLASHIVTAEALGLGRATKQGIKIILLSNKGSVPGQRNSKTDPKCNNINAEAKKSLSGQ